MWHRHSNFADVRQRYFEQDGQLIRQRVQDVEPVIDQNTRERNETGGWTAGRKMRKAASIPASLYYDWIVTWQKQGLLPDMSHPDFSEMANNLCLKRVKDGDFSKFRV